LICGYQPTFKSGAAVAQKPRKKITKPTASSAAKPGLPMETIASTPKPAQVIKPKTKRQVAQVPKTTAPKTAAPKTVVKMAAPKHKTVAKTARVVAVPRAQPKTGAPQTIRGARTTTRVATASQAPALKVPEPRLPAGYKSVWTDGRLNPERGVRTAHGDATMALIWTETVPRRLVAETGQDGTLSNVHRRLIAQGSGTTTGTKSVPKSVTARVAKQKNVQVAAVTPKAKTQGVTTGRFVQVAAFGVSSNAQTTAQKFARLGLPVVMREQVYKGRVLNVLYLGPFASNTDLRGGLSTAKSQGFSDAFVK
jgi:hypothetical protein